MDNCWNWEEALLVVPILIIFSFFVGWVVGSGIEQLKRLQKDAHKEFEDGMYFELNKSGKPVREGKLDGGRKKEINSKSTANSTQV